jgi:hypothetical protein
MVEPWTYLTAKGYATCVSVDDDDGRETFTTWEEAVKNEFEQSVIPLSERDVLPITKDYNSARDVYEIIEGLERAAKLFRERLENASVFMRDEWVAANGDQFDNDNRDEFIKPFSYDVI